MRRFRFTLAAQLARNVPSALEVFSLFQSELYLSKELLQMCSHYDVANAGGQLIAAPPGIEVQNLRQSQAKRLEGLSTKRTEIEIKVATTVKIMLITIK